MNRFDLIVMLIGWEELTSFFAIVAELMAISFEEFSKISPEQESLNIFFKQLCHSLVEVESLV